MARIVRAACCVAVCFAASASALALNEDFRFVGYARDLGTKQLLYVESHAVHAAGTAAESRVVLYLCGPSGPAFARKELDYGATRQEPSFTFVDARTGYVEGMRRTAAGPQTFVRESATAATRQKSIPANVAIVADAGFDEFVRNNWRALEAGSAVKFPFLVPSRLDYLTFTVKKHNEETIEGVTASVIRLNLSGFIGWFLPYIEVSYRKSDRVLIRYRGITNVRDDAGGNLTAQIDFPLRERSTAIADLGALRGQALVKRCP